MICSDVGAGKAIESVTCNRTPAALPAMSLAITTSAFWPGVTETLQLKELESKEAALPLQVTLETAVSEPDREPVTESVEADTVD